MTDAEFRNRWPEGSAWVRPDPGAATRQITAIQSGIVTFRNSQMTGMFRLNFWRWERYVKDAGPAPRFIP